MLESAQETTDRSKVQAYSSMEELLENLFSCYNRCHMPAPFGINGSSVDKDQVNVFSGAKTKPLRSGGSEKVGEGRDYAALPGPSQVHFAGKWLNVKKHEPRMTYVAMLEQAINEVLCALSNMKMPNLRFS